MFDFDLIHNKDCSNNQNGICWYYEISCDEIKDCKIKILRRNIKSLSA